ncbi:MAG: hypothetical protein RL291_1070 [Pseudomonadota bacterium]
MSKIRTVLAVFGLVFTTSATFAFDEQKKAEPADKAKAPAMETIKTPDGGTLKLPGIGQIPKLDFGLELLYGQNRPNSPVPEKQEPGDLQIRATIKYRTN